MQEPTLEALTARLDRLERQSRRWQRLAGLAAAIVGASVLLGAVPHKREKAPQEVRATRFILLDGADRPRAELSTLAEHQPRLTLADADGKPRLVLELSPHGEPSIGLLDAAGHRRFAVSLDLYGTLLRIADDAGQLRAALAVPAAGEPELELVGRDDRVRWRAP
jgi:hypothetical protein